MRDGEKLTASYSNLPSHGRHKGKALFNYTMEIKQIPILFSESMVQAILDGRKTQTRRVLKGIALDWLDSGFTPEFVAHPENGLCRYGYAGDQLWVRETFYAYGRWEYRTTQKNGQDHDGWRFLDFTSISSRQYQYADSPPKVVQSGRGGNGWYKRPSLFMPREASRITLEVTANRIEQLQDISEADAIAEGIEPMFSDAEILSQPELAQTRGDWKNYLWHGHRGLIAKSVDAWEHQFSSYHFASGSYSSLWEMINGPGSWNQNPYVTVTSFRRI